VPALADTPGMGTACPGTPDGGATRSKAYLILFRAMRWGFEIERVVHGARDIEAFLGGPQY
jgi:plasmid stabilization system protein ParE